jgi:hypothetical protein
VIGADDGDKNNNDLQADQTFSAMFLTVMPTEINRRTLLPSSGPVAAY